MEHYQSAPNYSSEEIRNTNLIATIVDDFISAILKEVIDQEITSLSLLEPINTLSSILFNSQDLQTKPNTSILLLKEKSNTQIATFVPPVIKNHETSLKNRNSYAMPKTGNRPMSFMLKPEDFVINTDSDSDGTSFDTLDMSDYANSDLTDTELIDSKDCNTISVRRNMFAFWLLGVCHKMTYHMALAATRDVLHLYATVDQRTGRACFLFEWSLLMSDAIPGFSGKLFGMFFPLYPRSRSIVVSLMNFTACLLVSSSDLYISKSYFLAGLAVSSCSGAIAEALYMSYTTKYDYSTLKAFSSGTGFGGVLAIMFYMLLRANGFEVNKILVLSLVFIAVEIFSFFVVLRSPCRQVLRPAHHNLSYHEPLVTPLQKWKFVSYVLPFMLPYTIQNFAQYMITRGANSMQIYGSEKISPFFQVSFISLAFSLGNMITRTFGNIADQRHLWLLACLQTVNCISLWMEVKFSLLPQLWQALVVSFWVGLVNGSSYLNTHYLITKQQPSGTRQFSHSFAVFGEQTSLLVALIILKPLFNFMCETPVYRELVRRLMYHYYG